MVNALNVWSLITLSSAVAQVVSLVIRSSVAISRCNAAIRSVSAMNPDNIVPKVVQLTRNVHAVKCALPANAELDAILEIVWRVNYVKMVPALLAAETIWTVQAIDLA